MSVYHFLADLGGFLYAITIILGLIVFLLAAVKWSCDKTLRTRIDKRMEKSLRYDPEDRS